MSKLLYDHSKILVYRVVYAQFFDSLEHLDYLFCAMVYLLTRKKYYVHCFRMKKNRNFAFANIGKILDIIGRFNKNRAY